MEQLEQQADPFRVDRLRQWLGSTEQRIDAATRKRENAAALFWDIPSHQLHLKRKVASGAGGTVWLGASYTQCYLPWRFALLRMCCFVGCSKI